MFVILNLFLEIQGPILSHLMVLDYWFNGGQVGVESHLKAYVSKVSCPYLAEQAAVRTYAFAIFLYGLWYHCAPKVTFIYTHSQYIKGHIYENLVFNFLCVIWFNKTINWKTNVDVQGNSDTRFDVHTFSSYT